MPIRDVCVREVVHAAQDVTVHTAAQLMRQYHVGTLVVTDESSGERVPVGVVTDRDIVLGVVAAGLDPEVITVGDLMGPELTTIEEDQGVIEAIEKMRLKGVRRIPGGFGWLPGLCAVPTAPLSGTRPFRSYARLPHTSAPTNPATTVRATRRA